MPHRIAIVGLGYVGLPLAIEFGRQYDAVGFDIDVKRVDELRAGLDRTGESGADELNTAKRLRFSTDVADIADCNVYIVTVPTPIDAAKRPDLRPLMIASETVGRVLKAGDIVIYESTVYPGCTEEVCVPILERVSGLRHEAAPLPTSPRMRGEASEEAASPRMRGEESTNSLPPLAGEGARRAEWGKPTEPGTPGTFTVGYSPERINPGDPHRRLTTIVKVTSGSTPAAAQVVDALYASIITAGTHKASSIKVAEAAKVIENTQRDLNIALVNDLAILFDKLGIDTLEVLEAAGTKWNFLPFRPGLVGGHCIGVDPYYLTHKAQQVGHHPQVILAGRRTNDGMGPYVAEQVVKLMLRKGINPVGARVLILGLTFKENCPDLRNTRVVDIVQALAGYSVEVQIHDPWANAEEARREYAFELAATPEPATYDAIILAVAHREFAALGAPGIRALAKPLSVLYDVKGLLPREAVDGRL